LQRNPKAVDLFDGSWRKEGLGAGTYRFRLIDEAGKININRVDENALRRIFTNLGVEEPQRSILVDSIMDWRDPDNLHRISGAENDYYLSLSRPYTARNGPLDTIEDLLWIRGMSSALFYGRDGESAASPGTPVQTVALKDIFTVDSPTDRINLRTASAAVIYAVLGIPLEKTRSFVEERNKLSEKTLGDLLPLLGISAGDASRQIFVFTSPSVVSVEAEGRIAESGLPRRVKGVVRGGAGAGRGAVQIVRWVDRDFGLYQR
jgi:general secretion pathway protein K